MSNEAIQVVRQFSTLKGKLRDFLEAVAEFVEDGMSAEPSVCDLAGFLGVSDRTVRRLIGEAVAAGELLVEYNQGRQTPRGKTNRYTILIQGRTELAGVTELADICMDVDSLSKNRDIDTYIQNPAKNVRPANSVPPSEEPEPVTPSVPVNAAQVMRDLAEYAVSGRHIWNAVKAILAREGGVDALYDILDYVDAFNAQKPKKRLGAPWIAAEVQKLADEEGPRLWRWCDQLEQQEPEDEFAKTKRMYGGYLQYGPPEQAEQQQEAVSGTHA